VFLFVLSKILDVNNHNFESISHNKALEILRGSTHLSITVKSNMLGMFWHLHLINYYVNRYCFNWQFLSITFLTYLRAGFIYLDWWLLEVVFSI
jgi:hypothetical protein